MKIAYIAHPIGGDVSGNISKIISIIRQINLAEPETIPFASYIADIYALDDNIPEERARGMKNSMTLLTAGFITELRLYGDKISSGMQEEVVLAKQHGIPIVPMTEATQNALPGVLSKIM